MGRRYLLITPCRNEADYLRRTLNSVTAQSVLPARWVIVDDGSTDATPRILKRYADRYPWISVVTRADRGRRAVGPGVIEAFYAGLETVDLNAFDYVCKLDADLILPPTYFERVMDEMLADPALGNFSGKVYLCEPDGRLVPERMGDENAIGAAKFYRVGCFKAIGGFVRQVSWDGIDGHLCRMKGWAARSADRPELRIVHMRQMGASQHGLWAGRQRWGFGKYYMGSALYYVAAVALYRMFEKPYVVAGAGILWGYLKALLGGAPRFEHPQFRRYLRRFELRSLVFGKRRTTERYHGALRAARMAQGLAPRRMRVLGVASGGGHWVELLRLAPAFAHHDLALATVDQAYRSEAGAARFYTLRDVTRWDKLRWVQTLAQLAWILVRERPDVVVSTGALPGYFGLRIAKWLGARTIWVDSIANVDELSLSGQKAGRHADLWLTQWPHLASPGGPQFSGTVL